MTKTTTDELRRLALAYSADVPKERMAIYCERLAGVDGDRLHAAVNRAIDECAYFPTIAEIKSRLPEPRKPAAGVLAENGVPDGWSLIRGGEVQ